MGVTRRAIAGIALVVLPLLTAPVAAADEAVQASGSIVYSWHGDPGRGCAQLGVCAVHGALVIQPQGGAQVTSGPFGREVLFDTISADVRVQEGDLGRGGTCVDELATGSAALNLENGPNGTVTAGSGGTVSSGDCAGPLAQELGRILFRGRRSRSRPTTYDLRGSVPFVAGPFTGTLDSTLVLRPAAPQAGQSGFSFSSGSSGSSSPTHKQLLERVLLRYRVSAPAETLAVSFGGEGGPFCIALATCGASGSLSVAFPRLQGEVDVFAIRPLKARVSRRQALRDFRAGKLDLFGPAPLSWVNPRVSETFQDGGTCTDTVPAPTYVLGIGLTAPLFRRALPVTVSSVDNGSGVDPLRTHCPGPNGQDVLSRGETLARARLPLRALLSRRWTLTLRAGGGFAAPGYTGTRSGELPVTLSLLKVIAGTQTARS